MGVNPHFMNNKLIFVQKKNMKKIIYAAVLLLGLSALSSCKKDSDLRETIPGTWNVTSIDFSYDGQKLDVNLDTDYLVALEEGEEVLTYFWMPSMKAILFSPIEFLRDGTVTMLERTVAMWGVNNGKLEIEPVGVSPIGVDDVTVEVVDGKIVLPVDNKVLAYEIVSDARVPERLEPDGRTHILNQTLTLSKTK